MLRRSKQMFLFVLTFAACQGLAAKQEPQDEDVVALTILVKNCAGCHQQANHPGALFLNKNTLTEPETIALVSKLVETSQMPPAHRKFKETADGKTLLKWLKSKKGK